MAKISPLGNLLKKFSKNNEEEKTTNIYDDGSVWTLPEETVVSEQYSSPIKNLLSSNTITSGSLEAFNNLQDTSTELDPLLSARNQVDYYTGQLNELGQEVEKPSILSKLGNFGIDIATRVGAIAGALPNAITGGLDNELKIKEEDYNSVMNDSRVQKIKELGFTPIKTDGVWQFKEGTYKENYDEADKLLKEVVNDNIKGIGEQLFDAGNTIKSAISSGLSTASGLFTGEYSDKNIDIGRVLENNRDNSDSIVSTKVKTLEAPGKYGSIAVASLLGKEITEEQSDNWGNLVADLGLSIATSGLTDLNDAGKTIKALRNADKLDEISKVNKFDDALKLAQKYNSYDDYISSLGDNASKYSDDVLKTMYDKSLDTYANDLIKDVNKGLGGLNNFEGLKLGNNVILSPEKISKISSNKVQSGLTQVGLGLYSPVGALMSNPVTDKLGKVIDSTETGTSIKNDINKLFKGGKNNEWITAMKDNPENALKYANERKQVSLAKSMSDERIQSTMETINKYSGMKETPEEITKIIEEPTTRRTREIAVEREINNPEYVSKMMKLGKEEYDKQITSLKTMKNKLVSQKEELSKISDKSIKDSNLIEGIDSEISNLQKRIDKVGTIEKAKSIDFNKQMKQFGYNDDYTELFDKAVKTDIETLTKEVGDRDLAEAMQESANRVLDTLDEEFDGLSDYFTTYSKIDKNKILTGEASDYFGSPEEIREFSNLTSEQGLEKARKKLESALDEDKLNGKSTELSKRKIQYSTELVRKYQKDHIREELKGLGIKIKDGDEYDKMINSLDMTNGDDFINMLKSKKNYISKSEAKAFKNKAIREHLGTEGKSLEQDLVDLAKKRINEGGETYTLKHTKNFKDINASKKQTKVKALEDFKVYKGKSANIKNSLTDEQAKNIGKQISYVEGSRKPYAIYSNNLDTKLKETLKIARNATTDDTISYVMSKDAKEIAKKFVEESGLDLDYKEISKRLDRLSYKEIKEELVKVVSEARNKLDDEYTNYVKALSDDEIELLKAQQSARRLQPQDVFGEFEVKNGQLVKANDNTVKSASFDKFKTESKKMEEAYAEAEIAKKDKGVLFEKAKNNTDDVLGVERGTPFEDASKNLTETGKDRDKWIDDSEFERKNKGKENYIGSEEFVEGQKKNKALENSDKYIKKQAEKNKQLYDMLVNKYGKEKGEMFYNKTMKDQEVKAKRLLQEKLDAVNKQKELDRVVRLEAKNNPIQEVAVSSDKEIKKVVEPKVEPKIEVDKTEQKALEKVKNEANKNVPIDTSTPLGKAVNQSLPDNMKDMVGIKLNTANGEIVIDKNITITELKKILSDNNYGKAEKGSKIVYTNTPIKVNGAIGTYVKDNDTIMINVKSLNKTQVQTILQHEVGHRTMTRLLKTFPNANDERVAMNLLSYIPTLDEKSKEKFISIMERANKGNSPTSEMLDIGIVSKYMSDISSNSTSKEMAQETYAELFSLYNNKNIKVAKDIRNLNEEAYNKYLEHMSSLDDKEVLGVSKLVRKRFGDDYANQIIELQNKKNALTSLDDVISKTAKVKGTEIEISKIEENIKSLEEAMDSHEFDEAGNVISTDYDTFFNKMKEANPEAVEEINKSSSRYKKLFDMEDELFEIDNTKELSNEAKEFIEEYKNTMIDIALREGIYTNRSDAEAYATYIAHTINPKFSDEADIIEKGKKLKAELSDPLNVYSLTRTKEGTLDQINTEEFNRTGKRIYEENINRILLKRATDSEKNILKKSQNSRILEEFSIPIVRNFDTHVNSSEHLMEHYGDAIAEKLGVSTKEVEALFKDSGKSSIDFLKSNLFEEYSSVLPDFKGMSLEEFNNYIKSNVSDDFYKSKLSSAYKSGKYKQIPGILFEEQYSMVDKFSYARSLMDKYGYADYTTNPLDNIPKFTDDGRPYVNKADFKGDLTKEMPYGIEGKNYEKSDPIKAYNEFVYKTSKEQNMIMVELPRENPEKIVKRVITNKAMEDIVKDRTTLAEKISDMMTGDKEAIEGFDALAGYNVVDPKKITLEEFSVDNGAKRILVDRNAWENYQKAIKDAEYKDKNAILKVYDYFNNMFKSQAIFSGAFHIRNGIQNVVASYVKTGANLLDPKKNKEALEILLYKNGTIKDLTKEYGGYNIDEILTQAKKSGIFETEMKNEFVKDTTKKFLKGEVDNLELSKIPLKKSINPFSTDFIGYRASQKLGGAIEEQAKMVNIITHLENGFDLSDAIELTKKTLFDYSDLTEFESKVMRRAFPFYTFMRKNIPSQIDNLANHSGRLTRVNSIYRKSSEKFESDKERALRPDYLDGQLAIGNQKFLNLGNATDDLNKLINPLEMASGLNPLIKTPIELLFNKQMYSGSDISKYDKNVEKAKYIVESSVPITRQVTALHKLITGTEVEQTKATKTLSRTIGNLVNEYDIEKQEKSTMYDYVEQLQNQYYEYLEKHPEAKAQLEEEKNKSTKANYVSPLSKLIKKR